MCFRTTSNLYFVIVKPTLYRRQRLQNQLHMLGVMAPLQSLVFRTVDGSILSTASFAQGHPDSAQQMCVVRDLEYNEWQTVRCSLSAMFVCQKDVVLTGKASVYRCGRVDTDPDTGIETDTDTDTCTEPDTDTVIEADTVIKADTETYKDMNIDMETDTVIEKDTDLSLIHISEPTRRA